MAKEKKQVNPTSVRITPVAGQIWDELAERMGLSKAGVLETLLREKAKQEGLRLDATQDGPQVPA